MKPTFIIAEIGINHNGDIEIAKELIKGSAQAGAQAVKFQKRTLSAVYTEEFLDSPRESPWGTTQREQKEGLEFDKAEYDEIAEFCQSIGIEWFASAWDPEAQQFLRQYNLKYNKIASAMLADEDFLRLVSEEKRYTFISTGMSTIDEIAAAAAIFREAKCPFELMHCNSSYPADKAEVNIKAIHTLRDQFGVEVGYSGHEQGRVVSLAAAAIGASSIERHVTLDRAMYGSDQAASINLRELSALCDDIRTVERAMGDGVKRITAAEMEIRKKLGRPLA